MTNETPDVLEQVPAGGGMNKPASGTYGEKTELADLQRQLPSSDAPAPPGPSPVPTGPPSGRPAPAEPPGMPRGLTMPTQRPDTPVSTPLEGPAPDPMAGAVDARQRRLRYLDLLEQNAESAEVREWASIVKQKLIAGV